MEYLSLREQEEVGEGRKKDREEKSATDMVREEEARWEKAEEEEEEREAMGL